MPNPFSATISTTIDLPASPTQVWEALVDFDEHARWNPFFASIAGRPAVGEQLVVTARKGELGASTDGMTFKPTVLEAEPNRLLRWRGRLLLPGIFDGTHSFELTELANGAGTRLVHGETFRGVLIPFTGKVLRDTEAGFEAFNRALVDEVARRATSTDGSTDEPCSAR